MIALLVIMRDAVLAMILGWLSVGSGGPADVADDHAMRIPLLPVATDRCEIDGDGTPRPEGA